MQNHSHYFIKINNEEKIKDYDNIDISDNFNNELISDRYLELNNSEKKIKKLEITHMNV